jgi:hypothetical protein
MSRACSSGSWRGGRPSRNRDKTRFCSLYTVTYPPKLSFCILKCLQHRGLTTSGSGADVVGFLKTPRSCEYLLHSRHLRIKRVCQNREIPKLSIEFLEGPFAPLSSDFFIGKKSSQKSRSDNFGIRLPSGEPVDFVNHSTGVVYGGSTGNFDNFGILTTSGFASQLRGCFPKLSRCFCQRVYGSKMTTSGGNYSIRG